MKACLSFVLWACFIAKLQGMRKNKYGFFSLYQTIWNTQNLISDLISLHRNHENDFICLALDVFVCVMILLDYSWTFFGTFPTRPKPAAKIFWQCGFIPPRGFHTSEFWLSIPCLVYHSHSWVLGNRPWRFLGPSTHQFYVYKSTSRNFEEKLRLRQHQET